MASSTSSYRIPDELRTRLENTSERLNRGKNWIVAKALEEYLDRHNQEWLREEARRQSLAVSGARWKDEEFWERAAGEAIDG